MYSEEYTNTTKGTIQKKNGQPVQCYTCGGNHYHSDCPQKNDDNNTGTKNITDGSKNNDSKTENNNAVLQGQTGIGMIDAPVEATIVGTANVTTSGTDDWVTFDFGGVQFLNVGTDTNN